MIRFSLLGSGSRGNALLIATPTSKVLIDSGLSLRATMNRVDALGESLEGLRAVVVTHEHRDHVNGLGVLTRKLGVPAYMTPDTYAQLPAAVGKIPRVELFEAGDAIPLDGLVLQSFSVSHDAADPVAFAIHWEHLKLGMACDLGYASNLVKTSLKDADALILESNYCPDMLERGPYPVQIQQRIRSRQGHLSNPDMSALLTGLLHNGLQTVVLAHISQENNTPRLAHDVASQAVEGHPAQVFVARQDRPTRLFEVGT